MLDVAREFHFTHPYTVGIFGFNPCYVGCCSGIGNKIFEGDMIIEFQSLLCWMLLGNKKYTDCGCRISAVSILVMLDVARE